MFEMSDYGNTGTQLVQQRIPKVEDAHRIFGECENGVTPLVLVPNKTKMFEAIPAGLYCLVAANGRIRQFNGQNWCEPGKHVFKPWEHVQYLVTRQYTVFDCPVKNCPTLDNVQVQIDIVIVFRIIEPFKFIFKLGPDKLNEYLRSSQEDAIRGLARSVNHTAVYDLRGSSTSAMMEKMNQRFNEYGVSIEDVTITNVSLPREIANALQSETTYDSKQKEQKMKQEYDMKLMNDEAERKKAMESRKAERHQSQNQFEMRKSKLQKEIDTIEGETAKEVAEIQATQAKETAEIQADTRLKVSAIEGKKESLVMQIKAQGELESQKIVAETSKYVHTRTAETDLKVAELKAKAMNILAEAQKKAGTAMFGKRKFDAGIQHLEVLRKLARNPNTVIAGNNGDNITAQIHAARRGGAIMGDSYN
eukprot:GFYU01005367.1.p1 GENE.GFYU01005367.1~~GFYU01005367.1.p1  ORF type:complete len:420 (+),score=177.89 GFYU01005367.1:64-1323(+)